MRSRPSMLLRRILEQRPRTVSRVYKLFSPLSLASRVSDPAPRRFTPPWPCPSASPRGRLAAGG
eukprot:scaffold24995_cov57-Phaeocystis_antarctica.AAC.2